jgi:DNA-binding beta-propeller fold protein YncE
MSGLTALRRDGAGRRRAAVALLAGLAAAAIGSSVALAVALPGSHERRELNGTIWVANRGAHTIRGFDAATGDVVATVAMAPGSQPGDLAYAKGKLYVAEEFGSPPALAVVDEGTGEVLKRILTGPRPHHVHASVGGNLVAYGVFGTNRIGIVDAHTDTLVGEWPTSANPAARTHAGVFSKDGNVVYVANDVVNELAALDPRTGELLWTMTVPNAHELAVTHDGKTAYVSCRAGNALRIVDLERQEIVATIPLATAPDTLQLSANEKLLTVGLRGTPAQVAVLNTDTLNSHLVTIGGPGTIAGHQWTSPNGHYTFAAFEGPEAGVAVIDHGQDDLVVQTLAYPGRPHGVDFARP